MCAAHLGFAVSTQPEMVLALLAVKLLGGFLGGGHCFVGHTEYTMTVKSILRRIYQCDMQALGKVLPFCGSTFAHTSSTLYASSQ